MDNWSTETKGAVFGLGVALAFYYGMSAPLWACFLAYIGVVNIMITHSAKEQMTDVLLKLG